MKLSRERLIAEANRTGFRPDMLEKVARHLALLDAIQTHPMLKGKLALKGGTALNLFLADVPRLSVDLDLNYVAEESREAMLADRPGVEQAVAAVCGREDFAIRRSPADEHAGGKWSLRYQSPIGQGGNLEVDLNFMFRVPLWPVKPLRSKALGEFQAKAFPVLDLHELAAGKLAALLARHASRDLFDAWQLLGRDDFDPARLRIAFVVYGALNRRDWRKVKVSDVSFARGELEQQLLPLLRAGVIPSGSKTWARTMVHEVRERLAAVLPLQKAEREFLDLVLDDGRIEPGLLAEDSALAERIGQQPMLLWKARNVREHRGHKR
jgi:predicted nucleotidyltransferase component of viral defense system